jgi:formamidopyrimidine-DNA glycosylase
MPELPEVEALRRGLVQRVAGAKILDVKVLQGKIVAGKGTIRKASKKKTEEFIKNLKNKKIVEIKRRAKNLIFILDTKEIILVHLKMTGQLVFVPNQEVTKQRKTLETSPQEQRASRLSRTRLLSFSEASVNISGGHPIQESENNLPHKHTYIIFTLNNGILYYNDVRQFGYVLYIPLPTEEGLEKHFENIGVEPFDKEFTLKYFKEKLREKNTPIKKLLLDQGVVVGCGNIYCDEIL